MDPPRSSPAQAGGNKLLWAGAAVVVILVLAMGASLRRIQSVPLEPRPAALPASQTPAAHAAPAAASAGLDPASSARPLPVAPSSGSPTDQPRIVHPRTSEPAVARAPERDPSKPDAVEGETPPGVKR